ncbi:MAG: mucoidy inhibitor MuiA family protein [Flammeovirgaceae bacterium]
MQTLESTITKSTVYTHSSAQITRFAETTVTEAGEQTLHFLITASQIEENSIQVKGGGNAMLKDVKLVTKHFAQEQHEGIKTLLDSLSPLRKNKIRLEAQAVRIKTEGELLVNLAEKVFSPTTDDKAVNIQFAPDKWGETLNFYRERQAKLDEESQQLQDDILNNKHEIERIEAEINELKGASTKSLQLIEVVLDVKETGKMQFEITYLTKGARWNPIYDIRVNAEDQSIQVAYNALVKNNTGENWDGVRLSLSTAKPFIGSKPPQLSTWFLTKYTPAPAGRAMKKAKLSLDANTSMKMAALEESLAGAELEEEPMELAKTTVDSKASSVLFHIGGGSTISSDNQPQRVTILQQDFKTDFHYEAVPCKSTHAYLKATVTNDSEYPLLAGQASVFMDNHFVAKSQLKFIAPNKEFELDLGIDENISIEFKELKYFWTSEGSIISKNKKKITFEYLLTIQNNKANEVKIKVSDQIPKPTHEELQVELIEPKQGNVDVNLTEDAIIHWNKQLKSGEEIKLPLKYAVMYPKDVRTELDFL